MTLNYPSVYVSMAVDSLPFRGNMQVKPTFMRKKPFEKKPKYFTRSRCTYRICCQATKMIKNRFKLPRIHAKPRKEALNPDITVTTWWARWRLKSKLRISGLCEGISPLTGEFPAQRASNAEKFAFDDVIISLKIVLNSQGYTQSWGKMLWIQTFRREITKC